MVLFSGCCVCRRAAVQHAGQVLLCSSRSLAPAVVARYNVAMQIDGRCKLARHQAVAGLVVVVAFIGSDCVLLGQEPASRLVSKRSKSGQMCWRGYIQEPRTKVGLWTYWYENGQKRREGIFEEDAQAGLWLYWHANAVKSEEGHYSNGKRVGKWVAWYANGQVHQTGAYSEGRRNGVWTTWFDNGQKRSVGLFREGHEEGVHKAWHRNGKQRRQLAFKNGQRIGLGLSWDELGEKRAPNEASNLADQEAFREAIGGSLAFRKRIANLQEDGLDVVFVFDSTASMAKPIADVQATIADWVIVLQALVPAARIGLVTYRDRGLHEEYRVREMPLALAPWRAVNWMQFVRAYAGGNRREDVHAGLATAFVQDWRLGSSRVVVLGGEAPPHEVDVPELLKDVREFASSDRAIVHTLITNSKSAGHDVLREFERIAKSGNGISSCIDSGDSVLESVLTLAIGQEFQADLREAITRITAQRKRLAVAARRVVVGGGAELRKALTTRPFSAALWDALVTNCTRATALTMMEVLADEATDPECRHAIAAALDRTLKLYAPPIDADSGAPAPTARLDDVRKRAYLLPE